jgi:hypothetical protein
MYLQLLTAATATSLAPALATDGFALRRSAADAAEGFREDFNSVKNPLALCAKSTAGSAVMTVTLRLWVYSALTGWAPFGTHATGATRGVINGGAAIDEAESDLIRHAEIVTGLCAFERVYLQVSAIGGTDTAVSAYLLARG